MAFTLSDVALSVLDQLAALLNTLIALLILLPGSAVYAACCCVRNTRYKPTSVAITGATSGIGEALALRYAESGRHLALSGRNEVALQRVAEQCRARGAIVTTAACDVTDADAVKAWLLAADAAAPVDLVIANAGVTEGTLGMNGAANPEATTRAVFAVNVDGCWNTIFPLLSCMRERGRGQIAILSSLAGNAPFPVTAAYSASKAAVRFYGEALRLLMYRDGVRVSVVQPGYVASPMTAMNKFPMPGLIQMRDAVEAIVCGLELDQPTIAFPPSTVVLTRLVGSVPWLIRDLIARSRWVPQLSYLRHRTGRATGTSAEPLNLHAGTTAPDTGT